MPVASFQMRTVRSLAKELQATAKLLRSIPVDDEAPAHPEIKAMLDGFRRINNHLSMRNKDGEVSLSRQIRIGRELERMGAAVRRRRTAR